MVFQRLSAYLAGVLGPIVYFSREELMNVFPHRGMALVASKAKIDGGVAEFTLLPGEFPTYCTGHTWRIPGHWLSEMGAQVAGLQAACCLCREIGQIEAPKYDQTILIKNGDWAKKPLDTNPNGIEPIIVRVIVPSFVFRMKMSTVSYEAAVEFCQGDKTAVYEGIRVILKRSAGNGNTG